MSRIANAPIEIPKGVETTLSDSMISVKGSKGNLQLDLHDLVGVAQDGDALKVSAKDESRQAGALAGTFRSLINNMVVGVTEGFTRKLEINGVGYRAAMQGNKLVLSLGFSHPVEMEVPAGLKVAVENNTSVTITGADKQLLGQFASEVRAKRPPEPFKGKGVKYADEYIVRKEGKKK